MGRLVRIGSGGAHDSDQLQPTQMHDKTADDQRLTQASVATSGLGKRAVGATAVF